MKVIKILEKVSAAVKEKRIYNRHGGGSGDNSGWRTFASLGKELGVSQNRAHDIVDGALQKIALSVFKELNGHKPTPHQLMRLQRDESFQQLIAEILEEA